MKELSQLHFPSDRTYTNEHIWVKSEGDQYLIGISDFAQDQLGEIVFVDLPELGTHVECDQPFGSVESMKSVNDLFMPFAGTVIDVNFSLADVPSMINASCYEEGWIIKARADAVYEGNDCDIYLNRLRE